MNSKSWDVWIIEKRAYARLNSFRENHDSRLSLRCITPYQNSSTSSPMYSIRLNKRYRCYCFSVTSGLPCMSGYWHQCSLSSPCILVNMQHTSKLNIYSWASIIWLFTTCDKSCGLPFQHSKNSVVYDQIEQYES